jgi:two-component system, OmpR family, alkaline phosphatase synthesis response regulator PhoP
MARVLIIEDSADLAAGLRYNLELEGYEVLTAEDGSEGLRLAREAQPDLLILDLMLPGIDGYQVLQTLRTEGRTLPVLILSARGEVEDRIRGFRLDADQYVTKPFPLLELIERVHSLVRRSRQSRGGTGDDDTIRFGDIVVEPESHRVVRAGEPVQLTPKAYDLMLALIHRDGAVATRLELLREVWGHRGLVLTRTVDSHIAELRRKLEADPAEPRHFVTVWKVGYRFEP